MFMKSKVCFTVFVLYEIIVIPLLHFKSTCGAIFGAEFCTGGFKYFPWAIALPLLVYIIWMWIHEIVRARRRRRFIGKAKNMSKLKTGSTRSFETQDAVMRYAKNAPEYVEKQAVYKDGKRMAFGVCFEPQYKKNGELKGFKYHHAGFFPEERVI